MKKTQRNSTTSLPMTISFAIFVAGKQDQSFTCPSLAVRKTGAAHKQLIASNSESLPPPLLERIGVCGVFHGGALASAFFVAGFFSAFFTAHSGTGVSSGSSSRDTASVCRAGRISTRSVSTPVAFPAVRRLPNTPSSPPSSLLTPLFPPTVNAPIRMGTRQGQDARTEPDRAAMGGGFGGFGGFGSGAAHMPQQAAPRPTQRTAGSGAGACRSTPLLPPP